MRLTLEGNPLVQQRHRVSKWGGMYDPCAKEKKALATVMLAHRVAHGRPLFTGRCKVEAHFYDFTHKRGQKPDIDNFLKAIMDAGNGVLWKDDSQIVFLTASIQRDSDRPRTELTIEEC